MDEPSRIVIVFNNSPLSTGDAGSGESNIRRWIIENDWLEGIVALPDQLFYNTGISTYLWILANRKVDNRKGKIQLVNATSDRFYQRMRKSLNNKRNEITDGQIDDIAQIYHSLELSEYCRVFDNEDFGYRRIRVERPLRLNFAATPERIERLHEQKAFTGLTESKKKSEADQEANRKAGEALQQQIMEALQTLSSEVMRDPKRFLPLLKKTLKPLKLKKPLQDAVLKALTERDPEAKEMPAAKGDGLNLI
jgi:type I restriction enzyme M protein